MADTSLLGASLSKWPSAVMISGLVADGIMSYDDKPSKCVAPVLAPVVPVAAPPLAPWSAGPPLPTQPNPVPADQPRATLCHDARAAMLLALAASQGICRGGTRTRPTRGPTSRSAPSSPSPLASSTTRLECEGAFVRRRRARPAVCCPRAALLRLVATAACVRVRAAYGSWGHTPAPAANLPFPSRAQSHVPTRAPRLGRSYACPDPLFLTCAERAYKEAQKPTWNHKPKWTAPNTTFQYVSLARKDGMKCQPCGQRNSLDCVGVAFTPRPPTRRPSARAAKRSMQPNPTWRPLPSPNNGCSLVPWCPWCPWRPWCPWSLGPLVLLVAWSSGALVPCVPWCPWSRGTLGPFGVLVPLSIRAYLAGTSAATCSLPGRWRRRRPVKQ